MPGTFGTTARNALRFLKGTSLVSDVDEGFEALANDVDTKMASYSQGTLAARPAAGQANRFYKATDTGTIYHDTGAAWEALVRSADAAVRLSWGLLSESGAITAGSGDFTVAHIGVGEYEVKWNVAKASASYAVIPNAQNVVASVLAAPTTAGFIVHTYASTTGAAVDRAVHFVVISAS